MIDSYEMDGSNPRGPSVGLCGHVLELLIIARMVLKITCTVRDMNANL